jgi:hypothetical protein
VRANFVGEHSHAVVPAQFARPANAAHLQGGPPNRRKQPERCAAFGLIFFEILRNAAG